MYIRGDNMKKTMFILIAFLLVGSSFVLAQREGIVEGTTETGNSYNQHMDGRENMMKCGGMMGYSSSKNKIGGGHMAYGMGGNTGLVFGMGLYKLFYFALAVFIFSVIFWLTHNWLVKHKKK